MDFNVGSEWTPKYLQVVVLFMGNPLTLRLSCLPWRRLNLFAGPKISVSVFSLLRFISHKQSIRINPFTAKGDLIDFTLSNARRLTRQRETPWQ